jgi:serine/threonine-protein kinase
MTRSCLERIGILLVFLLTAGSCGASRPAGPTLRPTPVPAEPSVSYETQVRSADGTTMVFVPAGEFSMGGEIADPGVWEGDAPLHVVYVDSFWIDQTEVTNGQYAQCVAAGACMLPMTCDWGSPTYGQAGAAALPVVCVDWAAAWAYCVWAGGRLPTEAQWEKAVRGPAGRIYPWGDGFAGTRANYCDSQCELDWQDSEYDDGYTAVAPVGSYPGAASFYGALDMAGNVSEWVADWYQKDYYAASPEANPMGPTAGTFKVLRGGSWLSVPRALRTMTRDYAAPALRDDSVGFRCVMP